MAASTYSQREACSKGHPYTPSTTYFVPSRPGVRYCRTCREDWSAERTLERRAKSKTQRRNLTHSELVVVSAQVRAMRAQGMTYVKIGEVLGCTHQAASRWAKWSC